MLAGGAYRAYTPVRSGQSACTGGALFRAPAIGHVRDALGQIEAFADPGLHGA
jgi:hypothetical protein